MLYARAFSSYVRWGSHTLWQVLPCVAALSDLPMCMAAKGWLICALSLSYRYSFVIQITLETNKRVSNRGYISQLFFCICNCVIFPYKQITDFGHIQFVNTLIYLLI